MSTFTTEDRIAVEKELEKEKQKQPLTHEEAELLIDTLGGSFALIRAVEKKHGII